MASCRARAAVNQNFHIDILCAWFQAMDEESRNSGVRKLRGGWVHDETRRDTKANARQICGYANLGIGEVKNKSTMSILSKQKMWLGIRRVLTPKVVISLVYFFKFGARISPRAEVELSDKLRFGSGCKVGPFVKIKAHFGPLDIGKNAVIEAGCFITSREGGTRIGDDFYAGPDARVVCGNYDYSRKDLHLEDAPSTSKGIVIGDRVTLGAGAMVADGAELGDDTIVLPGSLVTRKFKGGLTIGGTPARRIELQE